MRESFVANLFGNKLLGVFILLTFMSCGGSDSSNGTGAIDSNGGQQLQPLRPSDLGIMISEQQAMDLVQDYQSELESVSEGMQFYAYEVNEFKNPTSPTTPTQECRDYLVYKKTILKVEDSKVYLLVEKDTEASQQQCPQTIFLDQCIETMDNQLQTPDFGPVNLNYYKTAINTEPAILIKGNFTDPQNPMARVELELAVILTRPHIVASYVDTRYFYEVNNLEINVSNALFFTNGVTTSIDTSEMEISDYPNCLGPL